MGAASKSPVHSKDGSDGRLTGPLLLVRAMFSRDHLNPSKVAEACGERRQHCQPQHGDGESRLDTRLARRRAYTALSWVSFEDSWSVDFFDRCIYLYSPN